MSWVPILEGLASAGFFTGLVGLLKALLGKRKAQVDSAEVVQGMALAMITPFERRLRDAEAEVDQLRKKLKQLNYELDAAMAWRRSAEATLRQNGLAIPAQEERD
jgi:hypothetical protein